MLHKQKNKHESRSISTYFIILYTTMNKNIYPKHFTTDDEAAMVIIEDAVQQAKWLKPVIPNEKEIIQNSSLIIYRVIKEKEFKILKPLYDTRKKQAKLYGIMTTIVTWSIIASILGILWIPSEKEVGLGIAISWCLTTILSGISVSEFTKIFYSKILETQKKELRIEFLRKVVEESHKK